MKQIVPLTFGPGGERIGEAEVDFDNPTAPMLMRFDNHRDAEIMCDLVMGKIVDSLSIEPNRDSLGVTPVLPPEMRDTLQLENFHRAQITYPRSLLDNTTERHIVRGEH